MLEREQGRWLVITPVLASYYPSQVLEREREEEEASPVRETPPALGQSSAGQGGSSTGFRLDMNKISGAAAKAADEPDMLKWTPRAQP